jgi:sulfite reductase (NADPH) flavoprotein alpha-component
MSLTIIPETAPFSAPQRAWLNGFFAGLMGGANGAAAPVAVPEAPVIDTPWHDPALSLAERMALAEGKDKELRLMAAMGQLDCGQCGYDCLAYSKALSEGAESDIGLCQPGGIATQRMIKQLMAEQSASVAVKPAAARPAAKPGSSRNNPVAARLKAASPLNGAGSAKDTRQIVIDLGDSGLDYVVGDSLGVFVANCPDLVDQIIQRIGADPEQLVPLGGKNPESVALRELLSTHRDINRPTDSVLSLLADAATDEGEAEWLRALFDGTEDIEPWDILGLLERCHSARPDPAAFAAALGRLQPRLYSIASSPKAHPGEVHLTVGVVRYARGDRACKGVASTFLAERVTEGGPLSVYVQAGHGFRLPEDPNTPVIMIGPGTGIAPFRAFLQERRATGATGRNWLLFGDQRRDTDFLYQDELEAYLAEGVLTRLDLAFSREQAEKIYVQHRLQENAATLWQWLEDGAAIYVCGDASKMAKDVDDALQAIITSQSGRDGKAYLAELAAARRYLRDVY